MTFTLGTKPNNNGNIYRVEIDTENKTFKKGFNVGTYTDIHTTRNEINDFVKFNLLQNGYTEI